MSPTDPPLAESHRCVTPFVRTRYFHEASWSAPGWPCASSVALVRIDAEAPAPSQATRAWLSSWLDTHGEALRCAVLEHFFAALKDNPGWFDLEDRDLCADIKCPEDLLQELRLTELVVQGCTAQGEPVIGLGFECSWDEEHGAGVLACGVRCCHSGAADVPHLRWTLEECGVPVHRLP